MTQANSSFNPLNKVCYPAIEACLSGRQVIVVAIRDEDLSTIAERRWMSYSKVELLKTFY